MKKADAKTAPFDRQQFRHSFESIFAVSPTPLNAKAKAEAFLEQLRDIRHTPAYAKWHIFMKRRMKKYSGRFIFRGDEIFDEQTGASIVASNARKNKTTGKLEPFVDFRMPIRIIDTPTLRELTQALWRAGKGFITATPDPESESTLNIAEFYRSKVARGEDPWSDLRNRTLEKIKRKQAIGTLHARKKHDHKEPGKVLKAEDVEFIKAHPEWWSHPMKFVKKFFPVTTKEQREEGFSVVITKKDQRNIYRSDVRRVIGVLKSRQSSPK